MKKILIEEIGKDMEEHIKNAGGMQVGCKEIELGAGQILTTGASIITGDNSIMHDYDSYYQAHSQIW